MVALTWEDQLRQLHPAIDWEQPLELWSTFDGVQARVLACKFCASRFGPSLDASFSTFEEWRFHMRHEHER